MSKKNNTLLDYSNGIPFLGKMGYGLGAAAQTTIVTVISAVLTFYYSDVLGINIAAVGTIMLLSRFLDGGSDLAAGAIIDRTKSPKGKCRAWIWRMLIPHFISLVLLFTVPKTTEMLQYVYIFFAYNFANTFVNTLAGNAYLSMVTMMTRDPYERSVLNGYNRIVAPVIELIICSFLIPVANLLGGDQRAYIIVMICMSLIATLCYLFCYLWTRELPGDDRGVTEDEEVPSMKEAFKSVLTNKYWWIMVLIWITFIFYWTIGPGIIPYYTQYILGDTNLLMYLNIINYGGTIFVAIIAVKWILPKFLKKNIMIVACIFMIVGQCFAMIDTHAMLYQIIAAAFRGIACSLAISVLFAMIADCVEYSHWKTGIRAEGVNFSAATVGQKLGQGLSSGVMGWILAASGYDGNLDVQPKSALDMILNIYIWIPIVVSVIILILLCFHNLDKKLPTILSELQERHDKKIAEQKEEAVVKE